MDKTLFLNLIERYYGFQLNRPQLQFFYSSCSNLVMSGPRRCGKDFVAVMDSLYTCASTSKRVVLVVPNSTTVRLMYEQAVNMTNALTGYLQILRTSSNGNTNRTIHFTNDSSLVITSIRNADHDFRGYRINKAIIAEPDHIAGNIEELVNRLQMCMLYYQDSQLKIIGTHGVKHNLMAYMLSPYFEKISASYRDIIGENYSSMDISNLQERLDPKTFQLEILNEITPSILNEMLIN